MKKDNKVHKIRLLIRTFEGNYGSIMVITILILD
jgi:hypothetical protein